MFSLEYYLPELQANTCIISVAIRILNSHLKKNVSLELVVRIFELTSIKDLRNAQYRIVKTRGKKLI